jgi:hypothetical protein
VSGVAGVLAAPQQHRDEHAREHRDVLDREQRVRVLDEPAREQRDRRELGTNIEAVISQAGAQP